MGRARHNAVLARVSTGAYVEVRANGGAER